MSSFVLRSPHPPDQLPLRAPVLLALLALTPRTVKLFLKCWMRVAAFRYGSGLEPQQLQQFGLLGEKGVVAVVALHLAVVRIDPRRLDDLGEPLHVSGRE